MITKKDKSQYCPKEWSAPVRVHEDYLSWPRQVSSMSIIIASTSYNIYTVCSFLTPQIISQYSWESEEACFLETWTFSNGIKISAFSGPLTHDLVVCSTIGALWFLYGLFLLLFVWLVPPLAFLSVSYLYSSFSSSDRSNYK